MTSLIQQWFEAKLNIVIIIIAVHNIAENKEEDLASSKKKEEQLLAELDTIKHISRAKDQQILSLQQQIEGIDL